MATKTPVATEYTFLQYGEYDQNLPQQILYIPSDNNGNKADNPNEVSFVSVILYPGITVLESKVVSKLKKLKKFQDGLAKGLFKEVAKYSTIEDIVNLSTQVKMQIISQIRDLEFLEQWGLNEPKIINSTNGRIKELKEFIQSPKTINPTDKLI